jgi:DNA-binding NarL/FixJ family response regulator
VEPSSVPFDRFPIRLLIVDDHDILRYGVRALLRKHDDVEVVGEAGSVAEAVQQARDLSPDVVLMDARLPDGSGIDACREILSDNPRTRVLFFSSYTGKQTVFMAMVAGAHGHVSKDLELTTLIEAIRRVAAGEKVIEETMRAEVLALLASNAAIARLHSPLSPQEERVMTLVVEGRTNKEIAAALSLSDKTVKNYLYNAFQKLGIERRAQAAAVFDIARLEPPGPARTSR